MIGLYWFIQHITGLDNASGNAYLFWSGFFGDMSIFAAAISFYLMHTCHQTGCYRFGRHTLGHYKLCAKHHPDVPKNITHEHIMQLHKKLNKNG